VKPIGYLLKRVSIPRLAMDEKLREYELSTLNTLTLALAGSQACRERNSPGGASSGPDDERDPRQPEGRDLVERKPTVHPVVEVH